MPPDRINYNLDYNHKIQTHGHRQSAARGVVIHYAVGQKRGEVADIVDVLSRTPDGLGYFALVKGDIAYTLCNAQMITYHCSGLNTSHIGVAIAYRGPQTWQGDIDKDHYGFDPNGVRLWFPPYAPKEVETLALLVRELRRKGFCGDEVVYHEDNNPFKNDPGPAFDQKLFERLLQ